MKPSRKSGLCAAHVLRKHFPKRGIKLGVKTRGVPDSDFYYPSGYRIAGYSAFTIRTDTGYPEPDSWILKMPSKRRKRLTKNKQFFTIFCKKKFKKTKRYKMLIFFCFFVFDVTFTIRYPAGY